MTKFDPFEQTKTSVSYVDTIVIRGGGGNDRIQSRISNNNTLLGGDGSDTIQSSSPNTRFINGNMGDDLIQLFATAYSDLNCQGGSGNDRLEVDGSNAQAINSRLNGNVGDDVIDYSADVDGQFSVYGGAGNDVIYVDAAGANRDDTIFSGDKGDDLIVVKNFTSSRNLIARGGEGSDSLHILSDPGNQFAGFQKIGDAVVLSFANQQSFVTATGFEQIAIGSSILAL